MVALQFLFRQPFTFTDPDGMAPDDNNDLISHTRKEIRSVRTYKRKFETIRW